MPLANLHQSCILSSIHVFSINHILYPVQAFCLSLQSSCQSFVGCSEDMPICLAMQRARPPGRLKCFERDISIRGKVSQRYLADLAFSWKFKWAGGFLSLSAAQCLESKIQWFQCANVHQGLVAVCLQTLDTAGHLLASAKVQVELEILHFHCGFVQTWA